jgi:hypothetical protein
MELTRSLVNRRIHLFQLCSSWREQALVGVLVHSRVIDTTLSEPNMDPRTHSNTVVPGDDEIAFHTGRSGVGGL